MRNHMLAFLIALGVWGVVTTLDLLAPVSAVPTAGLGLECTFVYDPWIVPQCGPAPSCSGFCSKRIYHTYRCQLGDLFDYCTESIQNGVFYEYYTTSCRYHAPGCTCGTNWVFRYNSVGSWWRC